MHKCTSIDRSLSFSIHEDPSDHAFHPKSGRNVQLTENCTVARRIHSYKDGITFSVRPLKEGATFEVRIWLASYHSQVSFKTCFTLFDLVEITIATYGRQDCLIWSYGLLPAAYPLENICFLHTHDRLSF